MHQIGPILEAHPRARQIDTDAYSEALDALAQCGISCTICADACLSEMHVQMLAKCIELNLTCADSCLAATRALARIGFQDGGVVRAHLEACRTACVACAEECERHGEMEHCRLCAEACRSCEQACTTMLESMMATT